MESENVAALRRGFDAVRRGDLEAAADMLDPSFEIGARLVPEGRTGARGPEALLANVNEVREVFGDVTWEPLEIVDLGDRILVRVLLEGTAEHTALPIAEEIGHVYTFRDGRATRLDIYRSWAEAQRAGGVKDR
jgi:ketosteroid isomerase-like protein